MRPTWKYPTQLPPRNAVRRSRIRHASLSGLSLIIGLALTTAAPAQNAGTLQSHSARTRTLAQLNGVQDRSPGALVEDGRWGHTLKSAPGRGEAPRSAGSPDAALAELDRAIRREPRNADHFLVRGLLYLKLRDPDNAIRDFDRALGLNPRNADLVRHRARAQTQAHHDRAMAWYGVQQYDRAIRDLDQAINFSPDHAPAFNLRGLCYAAIGETKRAVQDFDHAVQLDRSFADAFVNRGNLHQGASRWERALADYSEAARLKPNDAYSLYSRGLAMRALGREAEALIDIARAKEIEPGISP